MEESLDIRLSYIKDAIYELEEEDGELFHRVIELFGRFREEEVVEYERLSGEKRFCIGKNILFAEPVKRVVKPQSKVDLIAMRRVIDKVKR